MFNADIPPLPMRGDEIIPLESLPKDGTVVPAEKDQKRIRLDLYGNARIPTDAEIRAYAALYDEAAMENEVFDAYGKAVEENRRFDEQFRRSAGAVGLDGSNQ